MNRTPQLSIVIVTLNGGISLRTSLNSILHQQTTPSFEVLVVSLWPFTELKSDTEAWDSRFKFLCAGQRNVNVARNLGLSRASGEIVLFLDDEFWIDDRLFLKKHFDAHQRSPNAIGIGGPYRIKSEANLFEAAYHWINSARLAQARIDELTTTELPFGNCSFKTVALRSAFSFDENLGLGASSRGLMDRLIAAGQELQSLDRLTLEHRPHLGFFNFVYRAINQGYGQASYEKTGPAKGWKFAGRRLTLTRHLQENSVRASKPLRLVFALYEFAFEAGKTLAAHKRFGAASLPISAAVKAFFAQLLLKIKNSPNGPVVTELFLATQTHLGKSNE